MIYTNNNADCFNESVEFSYKYETIIYNISISQAIDWFTTAGASQSTSRSDIYFYLYSYENQDLNLITSYSSYYYTDIFNYLVGNPINSYLLVIRNSNYVHNNQFCVNIDWSTANVNRT
ncbi:MAG: hypothetical protein ACTSR2_04620, partial [Candidatus Hodarchaeales archaeon]